MHKALGAVVADRSLCCRPIAWRTTTGSYRQAVYCHEAQQGIMAQFSVITPHGGGHAYTPCYGDAISSWEVLTLEAFQQERGTHG
jgi:hypothetical protein